MLRHKQGASADLGLAVLSNTSFLERATYFSLWTYVDRLRLPDLEGKPPDGIVREIHQFDSYSDDGKFKSNEIKLNCWAYQLENANASRRPRVPNREASLGALAQRPVIYESRLKGSSNREDTQSNRPCRLAVNLMDWVSRKIV